MAKQAYVVTSLAAATAQIDRINQQEGYPLPTRRVGGGIHVDPPPMTTTYTVAIKHPTRDEWAIESDAVSDRHLPGRPGVSAPVELDGTWGPAASGLAVAGTEKSATRA